MQGSVDYRRRRKKGRDSFVLKCASAIMTLPQSAIHAPQHHAYLLDGHPAGGRPGWFGPGFGRGSVYSGTGTARVSTRQFWINAEFKCSVWSKNGLESQATQKEAL